MARGSVFNSPAVLDEMLKQYEAGDSLSVLGRKYGVDHSTIYYWVKKEGVHGHQIRRPKPRRTVKVVPPPTKSQFSDPAILKEMLHEYKIGMSMILLRQKYKVSERTILHWTTKNGVRRERGENVGFCLDEFDKHYVDPRDRKNTGKTYAEYLTSAIERGDKTIKAIVGNKPLDSYI